MTWRLVEHMRSENVASSYLQRSAPDNDETVSVCISFFAFCGIQQRLNLFFVCYKRPYLLLPARLSIYPSLSVLSVVEAEGLRKWQGCVSVPISWIKGWKMFTRVVYSSSSDDYSTTSVCCVLVLFFAELGIVWEHLQISLYRTTNN